MSRKVVRSGVQHAVTFNAVTRNAVRPQYELKEGEPITLELNNDTESTKKSYIENTNFSEEKTHIKTNMQKIDAEVLLNDNIFREPVEKILTNQQSIGTSFHYKDNIQKFSDTKPIVDNRQKIADDAKISANHLIGSNEAVQNLKKDRKSRNSLSKVDRQVKEDSVSIEISAPNENELEAKIWRMKKKLQNANQKLKDIQERDQ
jgi:hypothetical protein